MSDPNPFGNPEAIKGPKVPNNQPPADSNSASPEKPVSQQSSSISVKGVARLTQELVDACVATGATGAAIALVEGDRVVCRATAGPGAPDLGVSLEPGKGLSGLCIQTRKLQQCNDTETDPRVDAAASRSLGVRSILIFPLMEHDQLFGIIEVLSSRPNAFGQSDIDALQVLCDRLVESGGPQWDATTAATEVAASPRREPIPFTRKPQKAAARKEETSPLDSASPRNSASAGFWEPILGLLVIAVAILLGTLVGWRMGWQKALVAHAAPVGHGVKALASPAQLNHPIYPDNHSPSEADECGRPASSSRQTEPPSGGLMVCQAGHVIFQLSDAPASTGGSRHLTLKETTPTGASNP